MFIKQIVKTVQGEEGGVPKLLSPFLPEIKYDYLIKGEYTRHGPCKATFPKGILHRRFAINQKKQKTRLATFYGNGVRKLRSCAKLVRCATYNPTNVPSDHTASSSQQPWVARRRKDNPSPSLNLMLWWAETMMVICLLLQESMYTDKHNFLFLSFTIML